MKRLAETEQRIKGGIKGYADRNTNHSERKTIVTKTTYMYNHSVKQNKNCKSLDSYPIASEDQQKDMSRITRGKPLANISNMVNTNNIYQSTLESISHQHSGHTQN